MIPNIKNGSGLNWGKRLQMEMEEGRLVKKAGEFSRLMQVEETTEL